MNKIWLIPMTVIFFQPPHGHSTRSSPYVTLIKRSSSVKVTRRSFDWIYLLIDV